MTPALFWVLLFIGVLLSFPLGYRLGYRDGERAELVDAGDDWDRHVDQALNAVTEAAEQVTPTDWDEAVARHPSNLRYLRDRRDKLT